MTWETARDLILVLAACITLWQLATKYLGTGGTAI